MRLISDELAAHLAGDVTTLATCYLVLRTDGVTFAATDHDKDIIFDEVTYLSTSAYTASDVLRATLAWRESDLPWTRAS